MIKSILSVRNEISLFTNFFLKTSFFKPVNSVHGLISMISKNEKNVFFQNFVTNMFNLLIG